MPIVPLRPDRRSHGAPIPLGAFEAIQRAVFARLPRRGRGVLLRDLRVAVRAAVPAAVAGPGPTCDRRVASVLLDLEARALLERVPGAGPARVRRAAR